MVLTLKIAAALLAGALPLVAAPAVGIGLLGIDTVFGTWVLLVAGFVGGLALSLKVSSALGI